MSICVLIQVYASLTREYTADVTTSPQAREDSREREPRPIRNIQLGILTARIVGIGTSIPPAHNAYLLVFAISKVNKEWSSRITLARVLSRPGGAKHSVGDLIARITVTCTAVGIGNVVNRDFLHRAWGGSTRRESPHTNYGHVIALCQNQVIIGGVELDDVVLIQLGIPLELNHPEIIIQCLRPVQGMRNTVLEWNDLKSLRNGELGQ